MNTPPDRVHAEADDVVAHIAGSLGRPAASLDALAALPAPQLQQLAQWIDAAQAAQAQRLESEFLRAVPRLLRAPLRRWVLD